MKVLITGAGGQLGRSLSEALTQDQVFAADVTELDIADPASIEKFMTANPVDIVLNAAAYTQVDKAEEDTAACARVNVDGPRCLAEATAKRSIPLLHVSTDYVFDGLKGSPYTEEDPPNPRSVYGRTKREGEREVIRLNPRHYIVRTAWLYAPWGQNFPKTILGLSTKGKVRVVNDQWGSPTYAPHLAEAISRLIRVPAYGVWHMAGSGGTTWYGLTRKLFSLMNVSCEVEAVTTAEFPRPAFRPPFSVLESGRTPRISLPPWERGLEAFAAGMAAG